LLQRKSREGHHIPLPLPFLVGTKPTNTLGRVAHDPPHCCYLATTSFVVCPPCPSTCNNGYKRITSPCVFFLHVAINVEEGNMPPNFYRNT